MPRPIRVRVRVRVRVRRRSDFRPYHAQFPIKPRPYVWSLHGTPHHRPCVPPPVPITLTLILTLGPKDKYKRVKDVTHQPEPGRSKHGVGKSDITRPEA